MGRKKKVPSISDIPEIPDKPEVVKGLKWIVSKGHSVTSLRGILSEGEAVEVWDFSGESPMESLETRGVIELS